MAASAAVAAALAAAGQAALGRGDFYKSKKGKLGSDIRKLPAMAYLRIVAGKFCALVASSTVCPYVA